MEEEISGNGGQLALRNVNLALSVSKVHIYAIVDLLAVSGRVEDVANHFAFSERMVSHLSLLRIVSVGEGHEEFAAREGVEVVVHVALDLLVVPNLGGFALGVHRRDHLVQVRVRVVILPQRLSVLGVSTATIVLLCAVVSEGNTTGGEGEDLSALQVSILALMVVKETRVVMIVNKDAKEVDIFEIGVFSVVSVANLIHRLPIAENVIDCVVHWVVEQGRDVVLVWGNVGRVSVEAFSHLENASSFSILFPELAFDFGDCVNANSIETVLLNDSFHPVFKVLTHVGILLVQIGEISQATVLNLTLIVPVRDLAVIVVVFSPVEGVDGAVVLTDGAHVVSNDVNHHPDAFGVRSVHQSLQIFLLAKVVVHIFPVASPVPVVTTVSVINDRRNPNGIEAHA